MNEEEILNEIDFCLAGEYITMEHRQAIEGLLKRYNQEREKNKKLEEVIKLMASDMERLGSTDELIEYYFKKVRGESNE